MLTRQIDLPKVKGVIFAGYPGQETGNALANVLWGDVNPSAKLAFTMGRKESDWPPNNILRKVKKGHAPRLHFAEGLAIDYKWFDKHNIDPRFEFGFGLSYTKFKLEDLQVEAKHSPVQDTIQQTNEQHEGQYDLYDVLLEASVRVTNTGDVFGGEAPQLYMSFPDTEKGQPPRHLRGYTKVWLEPGETKRVTFPLVSRRASCQSHAPSARRTSRYGTSTASCGTFPRDCLPFPRATVPASSCSRCGQVLKSSMPVRVPSQCNAMHVRG